MTPVSVEFPGGLTVAGVISRDIALRPLPEVLTVDRVVRLIGPLTALNAAMTDVALTIGTATNPAEDRLLAALGAVLDAGDAFQIDETLLVELVAAEGRG